MIRTLKRFINYTKHGELYSSIFIFYYIKEPKSVQFEKKYHPVLGIYSDSVISQPKYSDSQNLLAKLKTRDWELQSLKSKICSSISKLDPTKKDTTQLELGQCVLVQYRLTKSSPYSYYNNYRKKYFLGVLIDEPKNYSLHLRGIVTQTHTEMKFKMCSPLFEKVDILKPAPDSSSFKTNLLGLRLKPKLIFRFLNEEWISDKGRLGLLKQLGYK